MMKKLTTFDPHEGLTSDEAITAFMAEAFASEDADYIAHALGVVARAKGMAQPTAAKTRRAMAVDDGAIQLSAEDQKRFAAMLIDPPPASPALKRAKDAHDCLIAKSDDPDEQRNVPHRFSAEEYADLDAAEEEIARGDFATDEEIAAVLAPRRA